MDRHLLLGRGLPALKIGGLVRGSYRKFPGRLERGGWPVHCWKSWHRWPARVGSEGNVLLNEDNSVGSEPNRYLRCRETGGNEPLMEKCEGNRGSRRAR